MWVITEPVEKSLTDGTHEICGFLAVRGDGSSGFPGFGVRAACNYTFVCRIMWELLLCYLNLWMGLKAERGSRASHLLLWPDLMCLSLSLCLPHRVVKEEISDDNAKLPCFNGRVVSWVRLMGVSCKRGLACRCGTGQGADYITASAVPPPPRNEVTRMWLPPNKLHLDGMYFTLKAQIFGWSFFTVNNINILKHMLCIFSDNNMTPEFKDHVCRGR